MVLTLLESFLLTMIPLLILTIPTLVYKSRRVAALEREVKEKDASLEAIPEDRSEELTDFLGDMKRHGYGFVRIDPRDVLYRRPGK